jgi:phospholipid/cholesterol/gamma-HCH transport system substrate-binding protein
MNTNFIEVILGMLVILVAGIFFVFAYKSSDLQNVKGYEVTADFTRIDGLQTGNDVKISGVKIGSVINQKLDEETYLATITLSIADTIKLPKDTIASVNSEGLMGGKYVSLDPGGEEEYIMPGGKIEFTQSTPGLEQLLGQVIFNMKSDSDKKQDE